MSTLDASLQPPTPPLSPAGAALLDQARDALRNEAWEPAIALYEAAIEQDPDARAAYWELGVALILAEREEEAQTLWFSVILAAGEAEAAWTGELLTTLIREADRCRRGDRLNLAWGLRRHAYEIAPEEVANTIELIDLALATDQLSPEDLSEWNVATAIAANPTVNRDRWLTVCLQLLEQCRTDAALPAIVRATFLRGDMTDRDRQQLYPQLANAALSVGVKQQCFANGLALAQVALEFVPDDFQVLCHTVMFYRQQRDFTQAIAQAERCEQVAPTPADRVFATTLRLLALLNTGGRWSEAQDVGEQYRDRLAALIATHPNNLSETQALRLLTSTFCLGYLRDRPDLDRPLINQAAAIAQAHIALHHRDRLERYRQAHHTRRVNTPDRPVKIRLGYLSDSLRSHSVGWLARWPFVYHDRDRFEIFVYFINSEDRELWGGDPVQQWYVDRADHVRFCGIDSAQIADQIAADAIDILLDLDSLTVDIGCTVMALKPAPIQCSWLGFDATGLPTIDYYLADQLTLPDNAQDYYTETIWRLPHSYIAIDGFEQAVPTLHRRDLGIDPEAIVYFSNQTGQKRNPDLMRLQLEIVRHVPGSHLLIKGIADGSAVRSAFEAIAAECGVERDRLHFLAQVKQEAEHRANLAIADVVLDTYPYNGATTTLETLWAGIPLVTRAGQQFSGRNSFAMLTHVGVEAGIAWNDREYVEWGVRFGQDLALRQQVAWQLRRSRQTSPLWDGHGLTRDLEAAFDEMWRRYLTKNR